MSPCPQNLCTGGDAVWCLASALQDFGYGIDTGKLNRIFATHGAQELQFNQAGTNLFHRYVLIALVRTAGNRPVLVTSCDGLGNYRVRDPRNQRGIVNQLEVSTFITFA